MYFSLFTSWLYILHFKDLLLCKNNSELVVHDVGVDPVSEIVILVLLMIESSKYQDYEISMRTVCVPSFTEIAHLV
jgi:hypothetical protein